MFDKTGLKSGEKFKVMFVPASKVEDDIVRGMLDNWPELATTPTDAAFFKKGSLTWAGTKAYKDTVSVALPNGRYAGLWPDVDGEYYSIVE